jgi:hypothetical protein
MLTYRDRTSRLGGPSFDHRSARIIRWDAPNPTPSPDGCVRSICSISPRWIPFNKNRIERIQRDIRLDGVNFYGVLFQVAGRSTASHNGQGDVALIDKTRPTSYVADSEGARLLYIPFPRWPLFPTRIRAARRELQTCRNACCPAGLRIYAQLPQRGRRTVLASRFPHAARNPQSRRRLVRSQFMVRFASARTRW